MPAGVASAMTSGFVRFRRTTGLRVRPAAEEDLEHRVGFGF